MIDTEIGFFAFEIRELQDWKSRLECSEELGDLEDSTKENFRGHIDNLIEQCKAAKFNNAMIALRTSLEWLNAGRCKFAELPREIAHILDSLWEELEARQFYQLSPGRAQYFNRMKLFGDEVDDAFPSARFDIQEAGNCLATERNTAAVFHLMRVVEWGLRALGVHLGFKRMKSKIKKSGSVLYTPLAYLEWEQLIDQQQDRVNAKLGRLRKGPKKQELQEFYYPVLQDIRAIRDAWRNHVMHTRAEYVSKDAEAIFVHVKRLMSTLAMRVTEV
jgi:hypothetical protein